MTNSFFPAVSRSSIQTLKAPSGAEYVPGVLEGDVHYLFQNLVNDLHTIEPAKKGWCWGYAPRTVRGSTTSISNHARAIAIDHNAPKHPLGKRNTFSLSQRNKIRSLLNKKYGGVFRWGGDYKNRPDEMHFEVVGTPAAVKKAAANLRAGTKPQPPKKTVGSVLGVVNLHLVQKATTTKQKLATVSAIQRALNNEGLGAGAADGYWGPATWAAWRKWEQKCGYNPALIKDNTIGRGAMVALGKKYKWRVV